MLMRICFLYLPSRYVHAFVSLLYHLKFSTFIEKSVFLKVDLVESSVLPHKQMGSCVFKKIYI